MAWFRQLSDSQCPVMLPKVPCCHLQGGRDAPTLLPDWQPVPTGATTGKIVVTTKGGRVANATNFAVN